MIEEFDIVELEDELDHQVEREKEVTQDENDRIQQKERLSREIEELKVGSSVADGATFDT